MAQGRVRLLPSFEPGHRPLLYLVGRYDGRLESFRAFCTDAVIACLRGTDPESRFYYWTNGGARRIDLLAVIARRRVGFCFSDTVAAQRKHWLPLGLALDLGVIELGYLLNAGLWSEQIGRRLYERPIGRFLSACPAPDEELRRLLGA